MKPQERKTERVNLQRILLTSTSAAAMLISAQAHAQQTIANGTIVTTSSQADGETISNPAGNVVLVANNPAVEIANNDVTLQNDGTLSTIGVTQTVQVNADTSGAIINNNATGVITADSRAINVDGDNVVINNEGVILGTGSQRNGTVYGNRTSDNLTINNNGTIDAVVEGAGVAIEVGGGGGPISGAIVNNGSINGRGQAAASGGTAGDGIRFFGPGLVPQYIYAGDITNGGLISSDSTQGTVAGIRFANRVGFQGTLTNNGSITGAQNGLYFGNDADHTGGVVNNFGTISSDSRALNIDGIGLEINNNGSIIGTGDQRNGTVYADSTAQGFVLTNNGLIDAGETNQGAGFSAELSAEGNDFTIVNNGAIFGRGQAGAGAATAGDGLRFERERVGGVLEGSTTGLFTGSITNNGLIQSFSEQGTAAGIRFVNGVSFSGTLTNNGSLVGAQNGLYFGNATPAGGGDFTGSFVQNNGTISSDSRALNIDGLGLNIQNNGSILGTADQRNGTVYADSTAQDFTLENNNLIDAGEGNQGAGFSAELSADGNNFDIINNVDGVIQGRGQAGAGSALAGDGIRFERERVNGMLDGTTTGLFTGTISNSGLIDSESAQGTAAGIRFVNGVSFSGTIDNLAGGTISGVQNGLYFGNATPAGGGDFTGAVVNNAGIISSDSRALNIDGTGLVVNNLEGGQILGTGQQRNGTVYADSTAQDFTLNNAGTIDAVFDGAAFSAELSQAGNNFDIINSGTIQGRGSQSAGATAAGDGIRFERERVNGMLDGSTVGLFTGTITNSGLINSESTNGTTGGIRFVNGVSFSGTIDNLAGGTISGAQNGLYFGNATPAGGGDFTGAVVNNAGIISSDSRALNIDGTGLVVNNLAGGQIIGTGDQRNGTVYADSTAQDFTLNNAGVIDTGAGNQGAGFSAELSAAGNNFDIINSGTIQGRGVAGAGSPLAGDGLRFERERVNGMLDGTTIGLFTGTITNSGLINSEGDSGTTAGIRFVNGVSFSGTLDNSGTISGVQNGLYFGNATPAGGGDFTGAIVNNSGLISSGSRALNIDGTGLTVNNSGSILGTGAQRNGTVYADGTANGFTLNNTGLIDAVVQGSGVSLQLGVNDGDVRSFTLVNDGTIAGRGDALASGESAGLRLFNGAGAGTTVTVTEDIVNNGVISSETGPALLIENVAFTGTFINNGSLSAPTSVDASTALSALNFIQNGGDLSGDFIGSAFTDSLTLANGDFTLASNVLNDVNVTVDSTANATVSGLRTIDGDLIANGTLNFDLDVDSLAVDGDSVFSADSVVNIATTQITQADIGRTIDVVTETGSFTDNGVTVNVDDDDFLIDYNVVLGSIIVTPTAADLSEVSDDANISNFGSALSSAVANNRLQGDVFTALNNLSSATEFEAASISLLPAINDGIAREIFETQRFASSLLTDRLAGNSSGIWGQIFFRTSDRDAESLSSVGYEAEATGFTLGADGQVGANGKIGAFFSYADIDVDSDGTAQAQSSINSYQFSAYAGVNSEAAFVNAELGYSINDVDSSRNSITGPVSSDTDADSFIASVNGGLNLGNDKVAFTPFAGLRYATISQDAFTETGGLGLTLDADSIDFLEASIGVGISGQTDEDKDLSVVPFLRVAYTYDFIGDGVGINGSFNAGADSFRLISNSASDSRFDVGAGLDLVNNNGFSIAAEYQGRFASDYQSHTGGVTVRFAF